MPDPAPQTTTIGRLMFNSIVPEAHRQGLDPNKPIETKAVKQVLQSVADGDPDRYKNISHAILNLGSRAALQTESSLTLNDLRSPIDKTKLMTEVDAQERSIFSNPNLSETAKKNELIKLYGKLSSEMPETIFKASYAQGNRLSNMVASGARGNKSQLSSNIGSDWLVLDQNDNPIPIPIKHNYAEGLESAEYFGSAYGTRSGLVSVKLATADSGFASKQLAIAASDLIVTKLDCGTDRGIPVEAGDSENIGTLLARPTGGYAAGTILTARTLKAIKDDGIKNMLVRSPITCQAESGLCAKCSGVRERGTLPPLLDNVGLAASSAIGEPLSQGALSAKHKAGVAGAQTRRVGGFKAINALLQSPEIYPDGAPVATQDGVVTKIEAAPQGGHHVYVGDIKHYAPLQQNLIIKSGSRLEAGDPLTNGVVSPADVVKYKGIGEGRMHLLKSLRQSFIDNGLPDNRRNIEVLARAAVNHSTVTDPDRTDYLPDEVVHHSALENTYQPHDDTISMHPSKSYGQYLQKPSLYFTVGTRVTPNVAKVMEDNGENEIQVSKKPAGFEPSYIRLMDHGSMKTDLGDQLSSSYVASSLKDTVLSGKAKADIHGTSPMMPLAYAIEFGQKSKVNPERVGY